MIGTLRKLQKLISKFPSEARTPHSPPAQYQRSQGSPQPPSTVPAKPGLPTAPSTVPAKPGRPTAPSTVPAKPGLPTAPSTVPAKPGLPTAPQHSTSKARAPHSPPAQYQQSQGSPQQNQRSQGSHSPPAHPSAVSATRDHHGTACLSLVPEEAPSHQGPSQGLPASLQCQKKLPATRDHHRDCLPLSSTRRSSQPPGTITGTACLSPAPEEAPSHRRPSQGLPVISEHSLDIYTFKLETS